MINIVIIEDHPVVTSGIKNMLRPSRDNIRVEETFPDVDVFLRNTSKISPEVVLLDLYIPGSDFTDNIHKIRQFNPSLPILIYTSETRKVVLKRALDEGANAICTKNASGMELKKLIEDVFEGKTFNLAATPYLDETQSLPKPEDMEILIHLCSGLKQKEISQITGKSVSSIEKSINQMRENTGTKSLAQLIQKANALGWI